MKNNSAFNGVRTHNPWIVSPICVRTERVWPKLSSIQGIKANLVYIVSLLWMANVRSAKVATLDKKSWHHTNLLSVQRKKVSSYWEFCIRFSKFISIIFAFKSQSTFLWIHTYI